MKVKFSSPMTVTLSPPPFLFQQAIELTLLTVEHNIPTTSAEHASSSPRRRPDMSTFLSTVSNIDTSAPPAPGDLPHQNAHATPHPSEMAAAYRLLANALEIMRVDRGGDGATGREAERGGGSVGGDTELLDTLIEALMRGADDPPRELEGVPDAFLAELDRVPKTKLKEGEKCPICGIDFLDGGCPHPISCSHSEVVAVRLLVHYADARDITFSQTSTRS